MLIERLRLKNYKMFREVVLDDIPPLAVFVGVNGSGKTTLFDAFDFLRDSIFSVNGGIENALHNPSASHLSERGGFRELRTRNADGPIEIEMTFRAELGGATRPINYLLQIGEDKSRKPRIEREILSYPAGNGRARINALDFAMGQGDFVTNEADALKGKKTKRERGVLDPHVPAVAGIGQFGRYEAVGAVRRFVRDWHFFQFDNTAARGPVMAGDHKHLSMFGINLAGVIEFMKIEHPNAWQRVREKMARRVPGFNDAIPDKMSDGHMRLKFRDTHWEEPFDARHMSDGTLKMLCLLALLEDPEPRSLLCVEEPENRLYPYLLDELMEDFRLYAQRGNGQVLTSTHSYEMLNAAKLEEVFWLVKRNGISHIRRAKDDETISAMVREEDVKMGDLWRDGYLEGARPQ